MLTTKGTFEKYKTKSEKVIVLDYKKKKIVKFNFGISLNSEWFVRRKIN